MTSISWLRGGLLAAAASLAGLSAHAVTSIGEFGTISTTALFANSPALPSSGTIPEAVYTRSVEFDDTYSFTLDETQSLLASVRARDASTAGAGTASWTLTLTLLNSESEVLATGAFDPMAAQSTYFASPSAAYVSNGLMLQLDDLAAGDYQLKVTGVKSINSPFRGIGDAATYWGGILVSNGPADTSAYYASLVREPAGALVPTVTAVPEPGTWLLMGLGLVGISRVARGRTARGQCPQG